MINKQYLIISELGVGGFATVYKAWDNMLQKFVAIKKIHKAYSTDAKYVDMFQIGYRHMFNMDIIEALSRSEKPIMLKRHYGESHKHAGGKTEETLFCQSPP